MQVVSAEDAVRRIPDGATVVVSGNGSILQPELVLSAIERVFLAEGRPRDLNVIYPVVVGTGPGNGIDRFAHAGLVREVVASCFDIWGIDHLARMVRQDQVRAHCLPMGVLFQLLHAAADGQPGILTRIGLDTFVDPEVRGTGHNGITRNSLAERLTVGGEPYLFFRAPAVSAAILRGSVADEDGNISLYREPNRQAALTMALAARARGGPVIAQVQAVVRQGTLRTPQVDVPGCLVDALVVDPTQQQSCLAEYDPVLTGEWMPPSSLDPVPPGVDRIIARRAALELRPGSIVNLGFGLATLVSQIVAEEGVARDVVLSVEHGPLGGTPTGNRIFGAAVAPTCILRSTEVFALYHSGQLGVAILSAAQVDAEGNANVSRFGDAMPGPGGYIDITAGSPRIVLLSGLRAGGARLEIDGEGLAVRREGSIARFVPSVVERTFSARAALARGARVTYITDRCTFELTPEGLELTEVAPGLDVRRDVLEQMEFRPRVAPQVQRWPSLLFRAGRLGLAEMWRAT